MTGFVQGPGNPITLVIKFSLKTIFNAVLFLDSYFIRVYLFNCCAFGSPGKLFLKKGTNPVMKTTTIVFMLYFIYKKNQVKIYFPRTL